MFSAISGVLGKVFGTDKAVNNLLDKNEGLLVKAGSWLGGLKYTEEEKAEGDLKTREWGIRQLSVLEPFKVVQRIGFFAVVTQWVLMGWILIACKLIDGFTKTTLYIEETGKLVITGGTDLFPSMFELAKSEFMWWPIAIVFALYYSGGVLPNWGRK